MIDHIGIAVSDFDKEFKRIHRKWKAQGLV